VKDEEEFYVRDNGEAVKKKGEALTTYLAHRFRQVYRPVQQMKKDYS
jgi:hypothetical protein